MNNNDSDLSLLGFLSINPMHGYELHKRVTDLSGFGIVWNIKIGKLYAMLNRLEKEGYVQSTILRESNRPIKNEFSITEKGKKAFGVWYASPVNRGREFRINFLLKLFFTIKIGLGKANELIDSQIETCSSWLTDKRAVVDLENANRDENFPDFVNAYRKIQIQGYLEWLNWCKESLKEGKK